MKYGVYKDDKVKMRSSNQNLVQYDQCLYERGKFGPRDRIHIKRTMRLEGQSDVFTSQKAPKITGKLSEIQKMQQRILLKSSERVRPCPHHDLWNSQNCVIIKCLLSLTIQFVVLCYSKVIQQKFEHSYSSKYFSKRS